MSRQPSKTPLTWIHNSDNKWEKGLRIFIVVMIATWAIGETILRPGAAVEIVLFAGVFVLGRAVYRAIPRSPRAVTWAARRLCAYCRSNMQPLGQRTPRCPVPRACRHCGRMQPWAQPQPTPDHTTTPTTNPKEQ